MPVQLFRKEEPSAGRNPGFRFRSGGLPLPLSVMERITYLLFIKRFDELQAVEEAKAATLGTPIERRILHGRD
jgi:type I restriction enzyme M protein